MMAATAPQQGHFHHIEKDDVLQALALAGKNERRRISLIPGEPNIVFFTLPLGQGRTASVEFYITPLHHTLAPHTLYAVDGSYSPSHDDIHVDQLLDAAQLIYDIYIDVTWLKLNGDILKHEPQESFSHSALLNPPPSNTSDRIVPLVFAQSIPHENGRKRLRRGDTAMSDSDSEIESEGMVYAPCEPERNTIITPNVSQSQNQNRLQSHANKLTNVIKRGQGKVKERAQEMNFNEAVFQCTIPNDGKGFNVEQIENTLLGWETSCDRRDKRKRWTIWYFLSCLQMVKEGAWEESWQTRQRHHLRKHKPFQGAKVANRIINKLLGSDKMAAMGVYSALAECGYKLSKEAELSAKDIEHVSDLVAEDLRGQVYAPAPSSTIPFAGAWLSILFQPVQYSKICDTIGLPELACLRFESACSPLLGRDLFIVGVKMSILQEKWNTASSWTDLTSLLENRATIS